MTTQPRWLSDEEQVLWRHFLAANRKMERRMEETLALGGELTTPEFSVLVTLSEAPPRGLRLRDMCAALDWDRSRLSHQVIRMERRGLVTKLKDEDDSRGVVVAITEEGLARLEAAVPAHVECVRSIVFEHFDNSDYDAVIRFFKGVIGGAAAFDPASVECPPADN